MAPEAAAGKAAEHSSGLPQFDPTFWAGQMFWLVVIFALLYLLFRYVFIPRIGDTIAEREDRIGGDIGAARRMKEEADAQVAAVAAETAVARAAAQKLASEAKAKARAEADAREAKEEAKLAENLARAESNIRDTRDKAMSNVRGIAQDTAGAIVEKLTQVTATAAEVDAALAGSR